MPHVVEADGSDQCSWPELHPATRAAADSGVCDHHLIPAELPPADMPVPLNDACARQRPPQDVLERMLLGHHPTVLRREDESRVPAPFQGLAQEGENFIRERDVHSVPTLCCLALVTPADEEESPVEVNVLALEPGELALAKPRVERGCEERAPPGVKRGQHARDFLRAEVSLRERAGDGTLRDIRERIVPLPIPFAPREPPGAGEKGP
jgi:hypothetical protein